MTFDEALALTREYSAGPTYKKLTPKDKQAMVGELAQETELGQWPGDESQLSEIGKAKTYPELNKIVDERKKTYEQVLKARKQTEEFKLKDAAEEQARQRSSNTFSDRAKTLWQDTLSSIFPGESPQPPSPAAPAAPAPLALPGPVAPPIAPAPSSRFQVEEGEIIDTKANQIIPFEQFEKISTPQEKADVTAKWSIYHRYDIAGAREAGILPDETGHWDSRWKHDDNPRRFLPSELGIYDTKKNKILSQQEFDRYATLEQKQEYARNQPLPAAEIRTYLADTTPPVSVSEASRPAGPPGTNLTTPQIDPRTGMPIPVLKNEPAGLFGVERIPQIVKEQARAGLSGFFDSMGQRMRFFQEHPEQASPLNAVAMKVRELTGRTYKTKLLEPAANLMSSLSSVFKETKAPVTPETIPELVAAGVTRFVTETAPDIAVMRMLTGNIALSFGMHGLLKGSEFQDQTGKPVFDGLNMHGAQSALINLATIGILHGLAPTSRVVRAGAGAAIGGGLTAAEGGSPQQVVADAITFAAMNAIPPGNPQFMRLWGQQWNQPKPPSPPPRDVTPKVPLPGPPGPPPAAPPASAPIPPIKPKPKMPTGVTPGVSVEPPPKPIAVAPAPAPTQPQAQAPIVVPGPIAAVSPPVSQTPQPQPAVAKAPTPPPIEEEELPPDEGRNPLHMPGAPSQEELYGEPVAPPGPLKQEPKYPTVDDIHAVADEKGIPWDNNKAFMDRTEEVTGKRHLDELTPEERSRFMKVLEASKWNKPAPETKPAKVTEEPVISNQPTEVSEKDDEMALGTMDLAKIVQDHLGEGDAEPFDKDQLWAWADHAFGGTKAEGTYTAKDAYDAVEIGVNKWILAHPSYNPGGGKLSRAEVTIDSIRRKLLDKLPVMGRYRTGEQDEFQQFSTPPDLAYALNWVANLQKGDVALEPSAGVGGLAAFAKNAGANVVMNELSPRRSLLLSQMQLGRVHTENAEQLHNILADKVRPDVVIMNPPFSSTAGRIEGERNTENVTKHLEQALRLLKPGGRLIALVGKSKFGEKDAGPLERWIAETAKKYTFRGRIGLSGKLYKKYGTEYDNQILIFDKIPPLPGHVAFGKDYADVKDALPDLANIRAQRYIPIPSRSVSLPGPLVPQAGEAAAQAGRAPTLPTDVVGSGRGDQQRGQRKRPAAAERGGDVGVLTGEPAPRPPVSAEEPGRPGVPAPVTGAVRPTEKPDASQPSVAEHAGLQTGVGPEHAGNQPARVPAGTTGITVESGAEQRATGELTDSLYDTYVPKKLKIAGAKPHPGKLVESAAMNAVSPPDPTYTPNLPKSVITEGKLSLAQLEAVTYAGQAHERMLPEGPRQGFFIGDGTGVGKGREISGILLDNWRQGRQKAMWITEKSDLFKDAVRDLTDTGGTADQLFSLAKYKRDAAVERPTGILFTTYSTIGSGLEGLKGGVLRAKQDKKTGEKVASRLEQILTWLGKDFDGAIIFDESHNMQNSFAIKGDRGDIEPAAKALAAVQLQQKLPKARIVYVSATGATKVDAMAYAERLGLWGSGTAFANKQDFIAKIKQGGLGAMEQVAQEMKALGLYMSRSLSFDDVTFDRIEHKLTPEQTEIYDTLAKSWQVIFQNMAAAMEETGAAQSGRAKGAARAKFWGAHQRFFNQVLTAMQMPSVITNVKTRLEEGKAVVLQLTNTNEAAQTREIERREQESTGQEVSYDDLDMTPRQAVMDYVSRAFPVQQYEEYMPEGSDTVSMRKVIDADGNPVMNQRAVQMRDDLLLELATLKVPEGPLEFLLNTFGVDQVAEITGRKERIVRILDEGGREKSVKQKRGESAILADSQSFMDDKKQILVFSDKGGTGVSYHSDLRAKNQRKRVHYLLQAGWRADKAVQGFGRTHRTNQKVAPHYELATTNLQGHKRFISTIARRLETLGSLTKGQRQTGSSGLIDAKDNLENEYAHGAVAKLIKDALAGQEPEVAFHDVIEVKMGLDGMLDENGGLNVERVPSVSQFLNRILGLEIDDQNAVFNAFYRRMETAVEQAATRGELDVGMETIKADKIRKVTERTVYEDKPANALTRLVELEAHHKVNFIEATELEHARNFKGYYKNKQSEHVWGVILAGQKTKESGAIVDLWKMMSPVHNQYSYIEGRELEDRHDKITKAEGRTWWAQHIAEHSGVRKEKLNLLVGTMLRIWDRLPQVNVRMMRAQTDQGERFLGRLIRPTDVVPLLKRLGAEVQAPKMSGADAVKTILEDNNNILLANGWRMERRTVAGEKRIELIGSNLYSHVANLKKEGVLVERIGYDARYFVPTAEVFQKVTAFRPISEVLPAQEGGGSTTLYSFPANLFPEKKPPQPVIGAPADDGRFHSSDPDVEARYQAATKGISKQTLLERMKVFWDTFKRRATRKHEFLPETAEFSPLEFALDNLEKQKGISSELQMRALHDIVGGLSDPKMDLFTRKVILMDLTQEAAADRLLPYGYTSESVQRDLEDVDHLLTLNPDVTRAWIQRQGLWEDMKRRYVRAMDAIGFDVSDKVKKEDYFRHQILAYAQEMAGKPTKGTGERMRTPTGRSFLKRRIGSTYDINANYLQAEFEVLAQMDYDVHLAQVIKLVDDQYNIQPRLHEKARQTNEQAFRAVLQQEPQGSALEEDWRHIRQQLAMHQKRLKQALHLEEDDTVPMEEIQRLVADPTAIGHLSALGTFKWINRRRALIKATLGEQFKTWEDLIPEGYDTFQPREGNIFYMADTIPHQMVQQLMERMGAQMGITADDLKKVLAMGGKREQFVVPQPVADTLTNMKKPEYNLVQTAWAEMQAMWKAGKLVGPHSIFKYNLRNLTGDAEATFVGNPSGFLFAPRAIKELFPLFFRKGKFSGDMRDWYERGGMGTLLQINEMGDVNDLMIFKSLQEKAEQRGLHTIPAKVFNKYWQTARLATDYREAILRYANYLAYLDRYTQTGRPGNYGASIAETVDALPDHKDRSFKLSNELIGAYDRVSVNGQHLRRYWIPFWSWKEVNFTRYKRLLKNTFKDRDYSAGARAAAAKSAITLLKLAFVYSALQVWNHLVFAQEESELNERTRNRVHIILPPGKTEDGKITVLTGIGALGDLLSWVGLDSAASHLIAGDLLHDRMTPKELAITMLKAPFNIIAQALGPVPVKLPAELFAGKSSFPDVFNPQAIRDPLQHTAQQLTPFGPEYNAITGKPGKPYLGKESVRSLFAEIQDPGSSAYHNWQAIEDKWRGRMGKPSYSSYQRSPKGQALADWAQSLRMGDEAGIAKYKQQFIGAGGDLKAMVASVRALAPLTGLTKDERAYVLGQLDMQEKQVLKRAEEYYVSQMMAILPMAQRAELLGSLMEHGGLSSSIIPRKTLPPKVPDLLHGLP